MDLWLWETMEEETQSKYSWNINILSDFSNRSFKRSFNNNKFISIILENNTIVSINIILTINFVDVGKIFLSRYIKINQLEKRVALILSTTT